MGLRRKLANIELNHIKIIFKTRKKIISNTNKASTTLQKQAATDHQTAAQDLTDATACHDENNTNDAKDGAKSALDSRNTTNKNSTKADQNSGK